MIAGEVSSKHVCVFSHAHYRTCILTPKHEYDILHMHYRTCTLPCKHYVFLMYYLRATTNSHSSGELRCVCSSLGLQLHIGATSVGNVSEESGQAQGTETTVRRCAIPLTTMREKEYSHSNFGVRAILFGKQETPTLRARFQQ